MTIWHTALDYHGERSVSRGRVRLISDGKKLPPGYGVGDHLYDPRICGEV